MADEARRVRESPPRKATRKARETFLDALAATAHVDMAVAAAGFSTQTAYAWRRRDEAFAHDWRLALLAGYDRIEAALIRKALGLKDHAPVVDSAATGIPPESGEIDVNVALLLLARHRPTVDRAMAEPKAQAFRAPRDASEAALLAKLKAYGMRADTPAKAAAAKAAAPNTRKRSRPKDADPA